MKSNICKLPQGAKDFDSLSVILNETEKCALYNNLDKKQTGRIRLLSEELVEMLPELLAFTSGEFWIEVENKQFELHTILTPDEAMTSERREELLKISKSGKNVASNGIMNKIKVAVELMLIDYESISAATQADTFSFYEMGNVTLPIYSTTSWALSSYRKNAQDKHGDAWDELEKSIIANIADDVLVGITGKSVEVIVKKHFK